MSAQLQHQNPAGGDEAMLPIGFIAAYVLALVAGVAATGYFCRSMCCEMEMPGGWMMSMMWMRMPGQTWAASATSFPRMWLAMMVAMMLPSALPTFLKTSRAPDSLSVMAAGYFAVWLAFGVGIYALGVASGTAAMRWEIVSRAVPVLSGAALMGAGVFQFTRWKMNGLLRCRSLFGCTGICPERDPNFRLGCKQGAACCLCCAAPMTIQLVLGIMNPLVIIVVATVIAMEKLLPRPKITARLAGMVAVFMGSATIIHKFNP
jgi:predicted metal-binding membrane protein